METGTSSAIFGRSLQENPWEPEPGTCGVQCWLDIIGSEGCMWLLQLSTGTAVVLDGVSLQKER